jgi:hypothetical protein
MEALSAAFMNSLLPAAVSTIVGAVVSYIVAARKVRLEMRTRIDESLQETRTELYKELWEKTGLLPLWPKNDSVTYQDLSSLSEEFRDWYFHQNQGGMYLSSKARDAYGRMQKGIQKILKQHSSRPNAQASDRLSPNDYDKIRDRCSKVRTELTKDLLSRRRAF